MGTFVDTPEENTATGVRRSFSQDHGSVSAMPLVFVILFAMALIASAADSLSAIYGPALAVRGLGNIPLGGPHGRWASDRFVNTHTGTLESIRIYLMWDAKRKGYHGGTGGTVVVEVQSDDGTANHHPSGTTLASTSIAHPLQVGNFPTLKFMSPASLDSGNIYDLVFTNADPNPVENYGSLNSLRLAELHLRIGENVMKRMDGPWSSSRFPFHLDHLSWQ